MRRIVAASMMSAVLAACTSGALTRQERIVEEELVRTRFQEWVDAINNRDVETLNGMYVHEGHIDVIGPRGGAHAEGWEEQESAIRNFYNSIDYVNFVPQEPEVDVLSHDFANVLFRHSTTTDFRVSGRDVSAGFGMMLWEKSDEDDMWRIRAEIMSLNAPPLQ